jgi:hypothetical protein
MTGLFGTPNGYVNGTVSAPNVADVGNATPGSVIDPSGTFTFNSFYLTSAAYNGASETLTGKAAGVTLFTQTVTMNETGPVLDTFNWAGLDELDFSTGSGGTLNPGTNSALYNQPVFDNFTFTPTASAVPEPSSVAAFGFIAMFAAGLILRARRRKSAA